MGRCCVKIPKVQFSSSTGYGGRRAGARAALATQPARCRQVPGRGGSLAVQDSVASAMSKETLEHIAVLFAQQQPAALRMRS